MWISEMCIRDSRHTFDLAAHEVAAVNKTERLHRNSAAIITLRKCQEENRFATPDEQIILSKYVGWGGIPEVFDERADSWRTEYGMLKNILTPEEYAAARESTLTAFYTPPTVIKAVYKAVSYTHLLSIPATPKQKAAVILS